MSSYIKVNNFEIKYVPNDSRIDIFNLEFIFNKYNVIRFEYFKSDYKNLLNTFDSIINGNKDCIDLNNKITSNHLILNFDKDFLNFKIRYDTNIMEFLDFYLENNSIVRNSLREFIDKFKIPSEIELDFLQKYLYYNGIYFPRDLEVIPSKDGKTFLENFGTYIEDEKTFNEKEYLSINEYREKFSIKHDTLENVYVYSLQNKVTDIFDICNRTLKNVEDEMLQRKYFNLWKNKTLKKKKLGELSNYLKNIGLDNTQLDNMINVQTKIKEIDEDPLPTYLKKIGMDEKNISQIYEQANSFIKNDIDIKTLIDNIHDLLKESKVEIVPDEIINIYNKKNQSEKELDETNTHLMNRIKNILQDVNENDFSFIAKEINNKISIYTNFEDLPYILKEDFEILYDIVENEDQFVFEELRKLKLGKKSLNLLKVLNYIYNNAYSINDFLNCHKIHDIIVCIRENCIKFENIPKEDFYSDLVEYLIDYNKDTNYDNKEAMDILFDLEITKLINTSSTCTEKTDEEYSCDFDSDDE